MAWTLDNNLDRLIDLFLDPVAPGIQLNSLLLLSSQKGRDKLVVKLINMPGVEINVRDPSNDRTPLASAAANGHEAVVS
jgi:ankyrin repeat protein